MFKQRTVNLYTNQRSRQLEDQEGFMERVQELTGEIQSRHVSPFDSHVTLHSPTVVSRYIFFEY